MSTPKEAVVTDAVASTELQLQRRIFHLETLHEIGREIYPLMDARAILKTAAMMIRGTFGILDVFVCLREKTGRPPSIVYISGFDRPMLAGALASLPREAFETVRQDRVRAPGGEHRGCPQLASCGVKVWLPLAADSDAVAGIGLGETMAGELSMDDVTFLATLCEGVEIALKNAAMYQSVRQLSTRLGDEMRRDEAMHRITLLATTIFDRERLLAEGLKIVLDWLGVTSGRLCLAPDQTGCALRASLEMPADQAILAELASIEDQVAATGTESGHNLGSSAYALCLPVQSRGQIAGTLLAVGDRRLMKTLRKQKKALVSMVDQTMLVVEHNRLMEDYFLQQYEKFRIRGMFEQYVAPEIVRNLVDEGGGVRLGGERRTVSILTADICGSTAFAQREEPELVVDVLNRFFSEMTEAVYRHVGIVDKFIGDEIMATFGLIDPGEEALEPNAIRAVRAGMEMQDRFRSLAGSLREEFGRDLGIDVHMGLATGEVVVGNVGSTKRIDYTVVGQAANLVARLASLATAGQLIIDEETCRAVEQVVDVEKKGDVFLRGISVPVKVYQVIRALG